VLAKRRSVSASRPYQQRMVWHPYIMSGGGAFGRRGVFKAAGIDVDKDMTTYDQRRELSEGFRPAKQMYGWASPSTRAVTAMALSKV